MIVDRLRSSRSSWPNHGVALDAFRRFGKGRHAAALNFGDCLTYAIAQVEREPLPATTSAEPMSLWRWRSAIGADGSTASAGARTRRFDAGDDDEGAKPGVEHPHLPPRG